MDTPTTHDQLRGRDEQTDLTRYDLTESERHRILANDRRRLVLSILGEADRPLDFEQLVGLIEKYAVLEDEPVTCDVALSLHHVHLPMLADHDVVAYHRAANTVELR